MRLTRIAVIVLLGIVLVSTIACSSDKQADLSGTYNGSYHIADDSWDVSHPTLSWVFEGDTLTITSIDLYPSAVDVNKYSLHNAIQNGKSVTTMSLYSAEYNVTTGGVLERHGDCLKYMDLRVASQVLATQTMEHRFTYISFLL